MAERKEKILETIIREHIKSGAPVASGVLVEKYHLDISPATVRNEMAELEDEGLIAQPHTSAGRVPTEKAYRRYLASVSPKKPAKAEGDALAALVRASGEADLKEAAKKLAQHTDLAVFWAFHRHNVYYTGISNLFQQPEFKALEAIYDVSGVIDRIDEIVDQLFERLAPGVTTLVGADNPFGHMLGTVLLRYQLSDRDGIMGVIGPMRMNYEKAVGAVRYVEEMIVNSKQ